MIVGIPKGRLEAGVLATLARAGFALTFPTERALRSLPVEGIIFQRFKPREIPRLLHRGQLQAGFTGLDLLRDGDYEDLLPVVDLGFGAVDIVVAAAEPGLLEDPPPRPLVIATEYKRLAHAWAFERNIAHVIQETSGSTEGYVPDFADLCIDCVETGATLRENGLFVLETLFRSTAQLAVWSPVSGFGLSGQGAAFIERIQTAAQAAAEGK